MLRGATARRSMTAFSHCEVSARDGHVGMRRKSHHDRVDVSASDLADQARRTPDERPPIRDLHDLCATERQRPRDYPIARIVRIVVAEMSNAAPREDRWEFGHRGCR